MADEPEYIGGYSDIYEGPAPEPEPPPEDEGEQPEPPTGGAVTPGQVMPIQPSEPSEPPTGGAVTPGQVMPIQPSEPSEPPTGGAVTPGQVMPYKPTPAAPPIEEMPDETRPPVTAPAVERTGEGITRDEWITERAAQYREMSRYLPKGEAEKQAAKDWSKEYGGGAVSFDEISQWQADARARGASQSEALRYSQQMWQSKYGVTETDLVEAGQIMPGVTMEAPEGGIIPVGASVTKRDVDGTPTTYEKDGISYYVGSGAMRKEGYWTSDEYKTAQQLGTDRFGGPHEGEHIAVRRERGMNYIIIIKPDGTPMALICRATLTGDCIRLT